MNGSPTGQASKIFQRGIVSMTALLYALWCQDEQPCQCIFIPLAGTPPPSPLHTYTRGQLADDPLQEAQIAELFYAPSTAVLSKVYLWGITKTARKGKVEGGLKWELQVARRWQYDRAHCI